MPTYLHPGVYIEEIPSGARPIEAVSTSTPLFISAADAGPVNRAEFILKWDVLNLQGAVAISYKVFRAWVSEFQALPDFDSNSQNTVGIQTLKLEHEGWQLDPAVTEPTES